MGEGRMEARLPDRVGRFFATGNYSPADLHQTLLKSLHNLPASSCSDVSLTRVLKNYDAPDKMVLVESIAVGRLFKTEDGKIFKRGKQIRKRIECMEPRSGKLYLFSPVYEVEPMDHEFRTQ